MGLEIWWEEVAKGEAFRARAINAAIGTFPHNQIAGPVGSPLRSGWPVSKHHI